MAEDRWPHLSPDECSAIADEHVGDKESLYRALDASNRARRDGLQRFKRPEKPADTEDPKKPG